MCVCVPNPSVFVLSTRSTFLFIKPFEYIRHTRRHTHTHIDYILWRRKYFSNAVYNAKTHKITFLALKLTINLSFVPSSLYTILRISTHTLLCMVLRLPPPIAPRIFSYLWFVCWRVIQLKIQNVCRTTKKRKRIHEQRGKSYGSIPRHFIIVNANANVPNPPSIYSAAYLLLDLFHPFLRAFNCIIQMGWWKKKSKNQWTCDDTLLFRLHIWWFKNNRLKSHNFSHGHPHTHTPTQAWCSLAITCASNFWNLPAISLLSHQRQTHSVRETHGKDDFYVQHRNTENK